MSACLVNVVEEAQDLIEVADVDSVIVGTIQNGSTIITTQTSIKEYSEQCSQ